MYSRFESRGSRRVTLRWSLVGGFLGLGSPAGLWIILRIAAPPPEEIWTWVYCYLAIATLAVFGAFGATAGILMARLEDAGLRDSMTGLHNRRFLDEMFPRAIAAARRDKRGTCLLMLDLDHFKRVNDNYGHAIGDQTLCAIAYALVDGVRPGDTVVRFGGEEFVVLCPGTSAALGLDVAERLREELRGLDAESLGFPGPQTLSIGITYLSPGHNTTLESALEQADAALYEAKHRGRDRVSLWQPTPPTQHA